MSTLNLGGRSLATLYPSIWLCDLKEDVYVLKNLQNYIDKCVARSQFDFYLNEEKTAQLKHLEGQPTHGTPPTIPNPKWIKTGSGFSSIAAGFEGLVCGIKNSDLHIRMGVSYTAPEGTSWEKIICEASQIAVGKDCIVRRTSLGNLYIANVRKEYKSSTESLVPNWNLINVYGLRELIIEQQGKADESSVQAVINSDHLLLDERDRLFIVAPSGAVYGCLEPCSSDNTHWIIVSQAPPIDSLRPGFLRDLYLYFRGKKKQNEGVFKQVCVGKGALWCFQGDNYTLWQLVLSDFTTSGGVTELKTSWSPVIIPADDERTSLLAASKSTVDGIYAVMVKNSNRRSVIVAYSLNQAGSARVEIELPSLEDPASLVVALMRSSSANNTASANNIASANNTAPASKVHRNDTDICCENGDCHFCRNAQRIFVPGMTEFFSPLSSRVGLEEQGTGSSLLGKRLHPGSSEAVSESHLAMASTSSMEEGHKPKRRKNECYSHFDTLYCPLEGVEVQRNPKHIIDGYPNLPDPSVLLNPLPRQHIDTLYKYTFNLEEEIVHEELGKLKD